LQSRHAPLLLALPERPDFFVVHLDLLNLALFLIADPGMRELMPAHLKYDKPRNTEDLLDRKKNKEIYINYLKNGYSYAEPLVVNTLYLSFHRNAEQWNKRAEFTRRAQAEPEESSFQFMYDKKRPRQDIHRAIHESWFEALEELKVDHAYISKGAKGMLEIKELLPNKGAQREYPFPPIKQKEAAEQQDE
jgi:hypothetical protein